MMPPILCRIFVACLTLSLAMTVSIAMAQDDAGLTPQVANTFVSTDDTELAQLFTLQRLQLKSHRLQWAAKQRILHLEMTARLFLCLNTQRLPLPSQVGNSKVAMTAT